MNFATGAVLSQQQEDSTFHPIAFMSKAFTDVERNYQIYDKEMLVIIQALEEWQHFLEGAAEQIEIRTDHKNLAYFRTAQKLNRCRRDIGSYTARLTVAILGSQTRVSFIFHLWTFFSIFHSFFS